MLTRRGFLAAVTVGSVIPKRGAAAAARPLALISPVCPACGNLALYTGHPSGNYDDLRIPRRVVCGNACGWTGWAAKAIEFAPR